MEKTVRNQNLKFSVEYPDDDREGRGPTNYEVVKRRKVDDETEQYGDREEVYQVENSLSYDVASGSEITPCNKIDKPLPSQHPISDHYRGQ